MTARGGAHSSISNAESGVADGARLRLMRVDPVESKGGKCGRCEGAPGGTRILLVLRLHKAAN